MGGPMAMWFEAFLGGRRVPGSIPETTDFLTDSSGKATNANGSWFTKEYK